jgi:prepilin-type N-terminal cleavage/methylation domain-containing protein
MDRCQVALAVGGTGSKDCYRTTKDGVFEVNKFGHQRGFSLIEALVAFSIVGIGLLAVATFQSGLFKQSADNKVRTEALALAQQKIEQLKHYTQADEDAYIDEDGNGVMDAVGNYSDAPITGQNAVFLRCWDLAANSLGREVEVSVAWNDADNQQQTVSLMAEIPWISPRTAADQIVELIEPLLDAPTGRARVGDGNLSDFPSGDLITFPNVFPEDGMDIYQHDEDLLLSNDDGDIVLTLEDACSTETGDCTDFVRIAGTVYLDLTNTDNKLPISEIRVLASNAGYCQRWVPDGTLDNPPTTANGNYSYYHYTCYLGGGWHGNIGFVTDSGLSQNDKVCQGDPTSLNAWEQTVIALRRVYRGMLGKTYNGTTRYYSHGIKDATRLIGQDFVFTKLPVNALEGYNCGNASAPMTREDSYSGKLFADVPVDFVCLNTDTDGDSNPDYLDLYDTTVFTADTTCPYDPTNPPVLAHQVSGTIVFYSDSMPALDGFEVITSDGPGNCRIEATGSSGDGYLAKYVCSVYDWGLGWTGEIELRESLDWLYCPSSTAPFANLISDASQSFRCIEAYSVLIEGSITYIANVVDAEISSMVMENALEGTFGECEFTQTRYRCIAPYAGADWSGTISMVSEKHVCGSTNNVITLNGLTTNYSPYTLNISVAQSKGNCPVSVEGL